MDIFYNYMHSRHQGRMEMYRGELVPCFEVSERLDNILYELNRRAVGPIKIVEMSDSDIASAVKKVHSERYLEFLKHAWREWIALNPANSKRDAFPSVWPVRTLRSDNLPKNFAARMGLFSFDAGTPITAGTWPVAWHGAGCAISGANSILDGAHEAFVLTRPPGHHSGYDFFGGYCFINNAAVAAQRLCDGGIGKVAILDIDYHHGNGTQSIFYDRADVFFASIHGDPATEYPFFLGYADEKGYGNGVGYNLNIPLPYGTGFSVWCDALLQALDAIKSFDAQVLVVSLGLDTFELDPISGFRLSSDDYFCIGEIIQTLGLPTLFVLEGGYALDKLGINVVNVLEGFAKAS